MFNCRFYCRAPPPSPHVTRSVPRQQTGPSVRPVPYPTFLLTVFMPLLQQTPLFPPPYYYQTRIPPHPIVCESFFHPFPSVPPPFWLYPPNPSPATPRPVFLFSFQALVPRNLVSFTGLVAITDFLVPPPPTFFPFASRVLSS